MFSKNRDFVLFINDLVILNNMLINFQFDFYQNRDFVYDDNLLLSPFYSREKIEYLIKSANYNIKMYFPYFADDNLLAILEDKLDS
jgi:hypothetical protein